MIFSFYSKAERNGEIKLGRIRYSICDVALCRVLCTVDKRRLQTALMPLPFSSPSSLALSPPPPTSTIRFLSVHQCRGRGGGGLFWSMAGNQTMGREDVKQIGPITYLPTGIPQSLLFPSPSISHFIHTHTALLKHIPDTTHTNTHLTTNMLQTAHSSTLLQIGQNTNTQITQSFPSGWMHTYSLWEND